MRSWDLRNISQNLLGLRWIFNVPRSFIHIFSLPILILRNINIWHILLHFSRDFQLYKFFICSLINKKVINHFWFFETPLSSTLPYAFKKIAKLPTMMLKKLRSFSVLMQDVLKLFRKKHPPIRDRVKAFQVVIKVSSFLRNPVYSRFNLNTNRCENRNAENHSYSLFY